MGRRRFTPEFKLEAVKSLKVVGLQFFEYSSRN